MLVSALNNHAGVVCYGEVFNPERPFFGVRGMRNRPPVLTHYRNLFPVAFMNALVFRALKDDIRAVGFKILSSQLRWCRNTVLINRLVSDDKVRFIHIYREDKLRMLLSLTVAKETGVWRWSSSDTPAKPVGQSLDPDLCARAFSRFEQHEAFLRKAFAGPRFLSLSYERLVSDPSLHLSRIQTHLDLDVESLRPSTRKQRLWSPRELIRNYEELRLHFEGTRWGPFFDDGG
jgi:LPS sulfotransferase NodH